jgi:hypothetical protein
MTSIAKEYAEKSLNPEIRFSESVGRWRDHYYDFKEGKISFNDFISELKGVIQNAN